MNEETLPLPRAVLARKRVEVFRLADVHDITNVRVFGSVAHGDDTLESDIDLLVSVPSDMSLMGLAAFALDVEDLLGVKVDVVTDRGAGPDHNIHRTAMSL